MASTDNDISLKVCTTVTPYEFCYPQTRLPLFPIQLRPPHLGYPDRTVSSEYGELWALGFPCTHCQSAVPSHPACTFGLSCCHDKTERKKNSNISLLRKLKYGKLGCFILLHNKLNHIFPLKCITCWIFSLQ